MQNFVSVPFKAETAHGLSKINGIAKFSPAGIVLEFESKLFGVIAGGVKEVRVPIGEILDIKFRKGLFKRSAKIELRTKTFATLSELPNDDGKVTLSLGKDDLERGEAAIARIQKEMAAVEAELGPARTPVSELFSGDNETKDLT